MPCNQRPYCQPSAAVWLTADEHRNNDARGSLFRSISCVPRRGRQISPMMASTSSCEIRARSVRTLQLDLDQYPESRLRITFRIKFIFSFGISLTAPRCLQEQLLPERGALHPELPVISGPGERDGLRRLDDVSQLVTGRLPPQGLRTGRSQRYPVRPCFPSRITIQRYTVHPCFHSRITTSCEFHSCSDASISV